MNIYNVRNTHCFLTCNCHWGWSGRFLNILTVAAGLHNPLLSLFRAQSRPTHKNSTFLGHVRNTCTHTHIHTHTHTHTHTHRHTHTHTHTHRFLRSPLSRLPAAPLSCLKALQQSVLWSPAVGSVPPRELSGLRPFAWTHPRTADGWCRCDGFLDNGYTHKLQTGAADVMASWVLLDTGYTHKLLTGAADVMASWIHSQTVSFVKNMFRNPM
jgi:hypothetical protein